ncbi:MAG: DUF6969 family protein [Alphaproteobacteria bacterium]
MASARKRFRLTESSMHAVRRALRDVSEAELARMAEAGREVRRCEAVFARGGDNPVGELLRGSGVFNEWSHYPADDAYDPATRAQYYYHAHPPKKRPWAEHGHFHLFLRAKSMPKSIRPAPVAGAKGDALCHLVAISMDRYGRPIRLFTTNRWVTGETWYAARDVIALLDLFDVDVARPNWVVNRWLTALVRLFRPQIVALIHERDEVIARRRASRPKADALEDRTLEVTSWNRIDVGRQIDQVAATLHAGR